MKIVIVIDSWNKGNGSIVASHRLVNELQSRGHEITLVSTSGREAMNFNGSFFAVPGFILPGTRESMESMEFQCAKGEKKTLRKAFAGADIVQIQLPFFIARNAVRIAKQMKIPVIGACHLQSQNLTGAMGKDNKILDLLINSWFNYTLFNRVDVLHCPSEFAADLVKSKGCKAHFRVISNGIPKRFTPIENAERPEMFGDHFVMMNVGRHAMEKRQEIMIDAVLKSKYKDKIKLLICGKGETSERLKERGKELPVEPLVRYISDEEKHLFLNTADMYLHSSAVELESLSCLEALGCGIPCLIEHSPYSASSQFALDEKFLFKSIEELTAKIDYWYENRAALPEMKKKTLKMAEGYRMDTSIDFMEDLYRDVINTEKGAKGLIPKGKKIIPGIQISKFEKTLPKVGRAEVIEKVG